MGNTIQVTVVYLSGKLMPLISMVNQMRSPVKGEMTNYGEDVKRMLIQLYIPLKGRLRIDNSKPLNP